MKERITPYLFDEKGILVVIPTYNNESSVFDVITGIKEITENILVINDGSTDSTSKEIEKAGPKYSISFDKNRGKGAAIKAGLEFAKERSLNTIITFDADGQHLKSALFLLAEEVEKNPDSIIIGKRDFKCESSGEVTGQTLFGNRFSNFWIYVETGLKLEDTQSGLRAYPVNKVPYGLCSCKRYDFEIEILVKSVWSGVKIREVKVGVFYPKKEERVSHFNKKKDNILLSLIHTKLCTIRIIHTLFPGLFHGKYFPKNKDKERKGSFILQNFVKYGGQKICYLIALFPLLFYFATGKAQRFAMAQFYTKLGVKPWYFTGFKNFWYFTCSLIDRMTFAFNPTWGEKVLSVEKSVRKNEENLSEGSILVGAHYGDWFFCGIGLSMTSIPIALVIDLSRTPDFQRRARLSGEKLRIIDTAREPMEVILEMKEFLESGGSLCFMADRAGLNDKVKEVSFLGEKTNFSMAPFEIARIFKRKVYQFSCCKKGPYPKSPYDLKIKELWDGKSNMEKNDLSLLYVKNLEDWVRMKPCHWFNFYPFWNIQD